MKTTLTKQAILKYLDEHDTTHDAAYHATILDTWFYRGLSYWIDRGQWIARIVRSESQGKLAVGMSIWNLSAQSDDGVVVLTIMDGDAYLANIGIAGKFNTRANAVLFGAVDVTADGRAALADDAVPWTDVSENYIRGIAKAAGKVASMTPAQKRRLAKPKVKAKAKRGNRAAEA